MLEPLTVAAAQPPVRARDVAANALAHAVAVRDAGARLVVFPELSLTGYELDADPVSPDDPDLRPIVDACAAADAIALVGAPVDGAIAVLRIDAGGAQVVYRKTFLGGEELGRFVPGEGAVAIGVDGRRVGLGVCRDTGVERHVRDTAALGVDLYVAGLVHLPGELEEQDRRGRWIAAACGAPVVLASFAGPTGHGYAETAGTSTVFAASGEILARANTAPGAIARATVA